MRAPKLFLKELNRAILMSFWWKFSSCNFNLISVCSFSTVALKGHLKILILFFQNNQNNHRFDNCDRRFDTCTIVDSTLVQPSNQQLYNSRINACETVESMFVQASIRRFHKRRFDGCTGVDPTLVQCNPGVKRSCKQFQTGLCFNRRKFIHLNVLLYFLFNLLSLAVSHCPKLLHKHVSPKKVFVTSI